MLTKMYVFQREWCVFSFDSDKGMAYVPKPWVTAYYAKDGGNRTVLYKCWWPIKKSEVYNLIHKYADVNCSEFTQLTGNCLATFQTRAEADVYIVSKDGTDTTDAERDAEQLTKELTAVDPTIVNLLKGTHQLFLTDWVVG